LDQPNTIEALEAPPEPPRSRWQRFGDILTRFIAFNRSIPLNTPPAEPANTELWQQVPPPPPKPVDARLQPLRIALAFVGERAIPNVICDAATSPAAYYGALEAISRVTGHPVHVLGYRMQPNSRYSCDTSCMSKRTQRDALKKAIEFVESDHAHFVP
jgi:hypothetical protein